MTVSTLTDRISYAGNGITTAFAFPYPVLEVADLIVIAKVTLSGIESTLTLNTDYTVTVATDFSSATVNTTIAVPSGSTLTILRAVVATQGLNLQENDPLPVVELETALDRLTLIAQGLKDSISRAVTLSPGYISSFNPALPALLPALSILQINAAGNGFALVNTPVTASVGFKSRITTQSNDVILTTDQIVFCDATMGYITLAVPAPNLMSGMLVTVKKIDSSHFGITLTGGLATTIVSSNESISFYSDGNSWYMINRHISAAGASSGAVLASNGAGDAIFRAIAASDLPLATAGAAGAVTGLALVASRWISSIVNGVPIATQPSFSDLSGSVGLTTQVTGTLPVANGGTGRTSLLGPTCQKITASGNYVPSTSGIAYLKVRALGGGGGGSGSGTSSGIAAGNGGNTTFGGTLVIANGGAGATFGATGAGGSASIAGTGVTGFAANGNSGAPWNYATTANTAQFAGSLGGIGPYGGNSVPNGTGAVGANGGANSGQGGQGGANSSTIGAVYSGVGGGGGGIAEAFISGAALAAIYTAGFAAVVIGAAGTAGGAGAGANAWAGGTGGSGVVYVEEHYL